VRGGEGGVRDTSAYAFGGVRKPSVTETLQLSGWVDFSGIAPEVLLNAADRGTWTHGATALVDEGDFDWEQVPCDRWGKPQPSWISYVRAYERFRSEHDLSITLREAVVKNEALQIVGALDIDCVMDGAPSVIEIKTPAEVKPSWPLQLAAYALCLDGPRRKYALRLRRDGTYRLDEFRDPNARSLFLAAHTTVLAQIAAGVIDFAAWLRAKKEGRDSRWN
jgi:hypothetical protein